MQRLVNVAPVTATHLQVSSGPATAGAPLAVTVTALDDLGQVATHYNGTVALSNSDAQGSQSAAYTYQSSDGGVHLFAGGVTLRIAGAATVRASDLAGLNGSLSVQVGAAAAAQLQLTGLASSATAGATLTPTITALDAYGNTATTYTGTVHLSSSDATAVLPANLTFTAPQATQATTLVLKKAGTSSVTAADTGSGVALASANVSIQAAAAASIAFTIMPNSPVPASQNTCVGYALSDAYGNRAAGYLGAVTLSSSDANALLPAPRALTASDAGSATDCTVQLRSFGGQTLTAKGNSNPVLTTTSDKRYVTHACTNYGTAGSVSNSRNGVSYNPSLVLDGNDYPVIAWEDYSPGTGQIFARRWDGSTWAEMSGSGSASGISNNPNTNQWVSLVMGPTGAPLAVWQASGMAVFGVGNSNSAWAPLGAQGNISPGITGTNGFAQLTPLLALASDGQPLVAYVGQPSGKSDVYVLKFDGSHWAPLGGGNNVSQMPGYATAPAFVTNNAGTPYVAWQAASASSSNGEIYVATYSGGAWVGLAGSQNGNGISNTPGDSATPALALSPNGLPMVAWADNTAGNYEIYVRMWNGSAWQAPAGSASGGGISNNPTPSQQPDIASDANGFPVVTWQDLPAASNRYRIYLRRFDGTAWQEMFGSATDLGTDLGANNNNQPVAQHLRLTSTGLPVIAWVSDLNYPYHLEQIHACVWR